MINFQKLMFYLRNNSWKQECALSLNMGWRILVFYPKRSREIQFTNILSINVKPQNTFCLPWIMSILICLTVQILWLKDGNLYLRLQTMSHIFYAAKFADDNSATCTFTTLSQSYWLSIRSNNIVLACLIARRILLMLDMLIIFSEYRCLQC
jgi:hypothetical protein